MRYVKNDNADKVSMCRDYADRNCTFSEGKDQGNTTEYKCDLCNKQFKGRFDFMKHRNLEHRQAVACLVRINVGLCMKQITVKK